MAGVIKFSPFFVFVVLVWGLSSFFFLVTVLEPHSNELQTVLRAEEIRNLKGLQMVEFERKLWDRFGVRCVDPQDRVVVSVNSCTPGFVFIIIS